MARKKTRRGRGSKRYATWRVSVFKRDKYTCQKCGVDHDLNAHHMSGWAKDPKARYRISNGVTLCARCHYIFHEIVRGGARASSTLASTKLFLKSFDILKPMKIDPLVFMRYIKV